MNRSRSKIFCALAMAVVALFATACLIGFAACGGEEENHTHTVTNWTTTKDATCTENGTRSGVCDECGETVTETINALGHDYKDSTDPEDGYVAPTCTATGTSVKVCSRCGNKQTDTIAMIDHSYVEDEDQSKAATCGQDGSKVMKCSVCGAETTETIPATGNHTWDQGTANADGSVTYTCSVCGATKTSSDAVADPGTNKTTYRFEAEEAALWADENEMVGWLYEDVTQGNYIAEMGFIFDVQEDSTASGGMSVGYLAHNNPTATFKFTSDKAYIVTLTLHAASCHIDGTKVQPQLGSYVFGMMSASVEPYVGSEHDILTVNGESAALTGTLQGSDSVFSFSGGLNMDVWGDLTATIELEAGENEIVLTHDGAGVNWDYIEIATSATLTLTNKTVHTAGSLYNTWYDPNYVYEPTTTALVPALKEW